MEHSLAFTVWPWMGLGAAIVLLILAFGTDFLRGDTSKGRWRDPAWLAWLGAIAYMLHNVEEYGIDLTGARFGFPTQMLEVMGVPFTEPSFMAINLTAVWLAGPLMACWARKRPLCAAGMAGLELVNLLTHVGGFVGGAGYSAGLGTAVAIFLPLGAWTFHVVFGKGGPCKRSGMAKVLGLALVFHVFLLGPAILMMRGVIDPGIGNPAVQVLLTIVSVGYAVSLRALSAGSLKDPVRAD